MEFQPTEKSEGIESLLKGITGKDRAATIKSGGCMTCDEGLVCQHCGIDKANHHLVDPNECWWQPFRDAPSIQEYRISGMCQKCQDSIFGV